MATFSTRLSLVKGASVKDKVFYPNLLIQKYSVCKGGDAGEPTFQKKLSGFASTYRGDWKLQETSKEQVSGRASLAVRLKGTGVLKAEAGSARSGLLPLSAK